MASAERNAVAVTAAVAKSWRGVSIREFDCVPKPHASRSWYCSTPPWLPTARGALRLEEGPRKETGGLYEAAGLTSNVEPRGVRATTSATCHVALWGEVECSTASGCDGRKRCMPGCDEGRRGIATEGAGTSERTAFLSTRVRGRLLEERGTWIRMGQG